MEGLNYPICILKMNLQCCEDLPSRVKRLLGKLKGVFATTIDIEEGLIYVSGTVEPPVLITAIEKRIGQTPQIYAYEKDLAKANKHFRSLLKRVEDKEKPPDTQEEAATPNEQTCPVGGNTMPMNHRPPGPPMGMCMPGPTMPLNYRPPMGMGMGMCMPVPSMPMNNLPPACFRAGPRPRYQVAMEFDRPKVIPKATPAPYPFDFYESKGFPATDSPFRYFSDDHAQPCTIM